MSFSFLVYFAGGDGETDVFVNIGASIDRACCTQWVGETYLEAMAPTTASSIGRSEFLNAWKDLLPESWRDDVAFSKLTVRRTPASLDYSLHWSSIITR